MISLLIPRRMRRMRISRDLKIKVAWTFFISLFLIIFINSFGLLEIYFEKDFTTEFSYPLDVPDFRSLVHRFKNGENVEHQPINNNYSNIDFITTATPNRLCSVGHPVGLLILVKSAPHYFDKRSSIRDTWGSHDYLNKLSSSLHPTSQLLQSYCSKFYSGNLSSCTSTHDFPIKLVFLLGVDSTNKKRNSRARVMTSTVSQNKYSTTHHPKGKGNLRDLHLETFVSKEEEKLQHMKDKDSSQIKQDKKSYMERRLMRLNLRESSSSRSRDDNLINNEESSDADLLQKEILTYGDIIIGDFVDSYENNTYKTMVGLKWALEGCAHFQYAFLVDDDMFINLRNLIKLMEGPRGYPKDEKDLDDDEISKQESQSRNEYLYVGKVLRDIKPSRRSSSKWYLSLEEYPFNYFPPYIPAAAILMSRLTVEDFYYASFFTQHFRFDDIYLSILAHKMNITPVNSNYFYVCHTTLGRCDNALDHDTSVFSDPMEFVVARHGLASPKELIELWNEQKGMGKV